MAIDTSTLHPSTRLGLHAIKWLGPQRTYSNILDMGCGCGVLSIAASHAWDAQILGTDISANAIQDAQTAVSDYGLNDKISIVRSDRFAAPHITEQAPYDLIIANLLDQWLIEMASDTIKHLAPGGSILLSGMLEWMSAETLQAHTSLGFEITQEFSSPPWRAALLTSKL